MENQTLEELKKYLEKIKKENEKLKEEIKKKEVLLQILENEV